MALRDSCALMQAAGRRTPPTLIDQGDNDPFLAGQLQPAVLAEVARQKARPLTLRIQPGYDSYYFIASFIEEDHRASINANAPRSASRRMFRPTGRVFSAGNQKR